MPLFFCLSLLEIYLWRRAGVARLKRATPPKIEIIPCGRLFYENYSLLLLIFCE